MRFKIAVGCLVAAIASFPLPAMAGRPTCFGEPATIVSNARLITGTNGEDVIVGGDGDNDIRGRGGNDRICGGPGFDDLHGQRARDMLSGGPDGDRLFGGGGRDLLEGDGDVDSLYGGPGSDFIDGGSDAGHGDVVFYSDASFPVQLDLVAGEVFTGEDRDRLRRVERAVGSEFYDTMRGDENDNSFTGIGGDDFLDGRGGFDGLFGGLGTDTCVNGEDVADCENEPLGRRSHK